METMHFIANDAKAVEDMLCNRTKGTYLIDECLSVYSHGVLVLIR